MTTDKPIAQVEDLLKLGFSKKKLGVNNKYHPPVRRTVKIGLKDVAGGYLEASDGTVYYRTPAGTLLSKRERMTKAEKKKAKRERTKQKGATP